MSENNMALLVFLSEAVVISLSGVMAPGPVTAVAVGKGGESPHAGALIAIGHGLIEIPLMVAIFYGIGYILDLPHVKTAIGLAGGLILVLMAIAMFRSAMQSEIASGIHSRSPIIAGMLLSVANPYLLIWWSTVGAALILQSVNFGLIGFATFVLLHWLCDFLWYYFLSALSFRGGQFFGRRLQKVVFAVCGVLLIYFSVKLVVDALGALLA